MPPEPETSPAGQRCLPIARGASVLALAIGLFVLAGWALDFRPLMTVLPGLVAMKPNTALGFCFAGLSLFFFTSLAAGRARQLSAAFALAVALLAALTAGEYATGCDFGIDQLLFQDYVRSSAPGRMAPITTFNFASLAVALLLLRRPRRTAWVHGLAAGAAFTSLLAIIGYFFGVESLYQTGHLTAVALHTAIGFVTLSIGVWCASSDYGFMRAVTGSGTSGMLVRRYGLAAIVLPIVFGWLRLQGELHGWFGAEFGSALFAMANVATFATLIWIGAGSLRMAEHKEALVQESLRQMRLELEDRVLQRTSELAETNAVLHEQIWERARAEHANQQILDNSLDVICTMDAAGRFLQVSRASEAVWGYRPEELIGRQFLEMVHPDDREKTIAVDATIMAGEAQNGFENRYLRKDGSAVPIVWTANWSEAHQTNFCVARDVTVRKQMESELLRARENAEAANRAKSEFLANMSHEIRTPMNGIIGMTELVLETELAREQREYLGMAKSSALSLLSLINDILDFSKIEAGKLELEAIGFGLRDCLGTMLRSLGLRADQKGLELTADLPAEVPDHLIGDPMRLRQILINLIDNAIKFTTRGDVMLRVALEPAPDSESAPLNAQPSTLNFSVTDTGIGIPAAKQALIFEAFAQADGSTTRHYGGTGLGLAIASQLVQQMGGRMWVESRVGEGTTFHFTAQLPVLPTPAPNVRHADPRELNGLRVLVVDDNAVNRRILHDMLAHWRMQPTVLASAEAAIVDLLRAAHAGTPYPLVILDGMMPEVDGFMLAERIREHAGHSGATVMMLSSAMPAGTAARCGTLGVASYLTKPVGQAELLDAILIALGSAAEKSSSSSYSSSTGEAEASRTRMRTKDEDEPKGLRILLAEDNVINRALATGLLEKRGHSLVHAANGREAVEAVACEPFDLILMDVQMPEMDGFEATRLIREAEQATGRHTPIAAMTAHAMAGDRERCLAAGMDDYLSKPLQKAGLLALLARIAGLRRGTAITVLAADGV